MKTRSITWVCFAAITLLWTASASAEPHNARQIPEGYWIGGAPTVEDVPWFVENGITLVVGATSVEDEFRDLLRDEDISWRRASFAHDDPDTERLAELTAELPPEQVYLHCTHGADRTGAMVAYLLAVRHDWRPDHAFLAVVYPDGRDEDRLVELLIGAGFIITDEERSDLAGIYSGTRNGGSGGLKVRSEGYRSLIHNTIIAIMEQGVPLDDDGVRWTDDEIAAYLETGDAPIWFDEEQEALEALEEEAEAEESDPAEEEAHLDVDALPEDD